MEIQHKQDATGGEFTIREGGARVGELTYSLSSGVITVRHTGVEEAMEGRGIGKRLMGEAVNFARESGYKVAATCSFARALLDKVPAYADVKAGS